MKAYFRSFTGVQTYEEGFNGDLSLMVVVYMYHSTVSMQFNQLFGILLDTLHDVIV